MVVNDRESLIAGGVVRTRALPGKAAGKDQRVVVDLGALAGEIKTGAEGVLRDRAVGEVALKSIGEIAAKGAGGFAIVDQIAVLVGMKGQRRVAAEGSDLIVEVTGQ